MGASESKLTFKEDVFRLAREDNIAADSAWWAQFYQLPETAEDVFALWSPSDIRSLTLPHERSPQSPGAPKKNLETLVYSAVARTLVIVSGKGFQDPHEAIAPELLNCIRILTRVLPFIYEDEGLDDWEDRFFWQPRRPQQIWDANRNRAGPFFDGLFPSRVLKPTNSEEDVSTREIDRPLGEVLVDLLLQLLFFPGFTLPKKLDKDGMPEFRALYHIWNSGVGARHSAGMTREHERNAGEVLSLLITLASRQLYVQSYAVVSCNTKALTYIATKCDRQVALTLICSLLNTVMKYNPASWRIPIDMTTGGDVKARLVNLSLEMLLVLLLYPVPNGETNVFRKNISRLHRVEDFQFILSGLSMVLTQPISGVSFQLGLNRPVPWAPDSLMIFWELLQANKRFRAFVVETDRVHDFLVLVLYYAMTYKSDASTLGLVRMCVFILQTISVEPAFGSRLNKPFLGQEGLPPALKIKNFHGNDGDFLITTIHTLMTTTHGKLESIYPALLAVINNIAPYLQDLGRATSSKLMELYVSLSSPVFLLEKEQNHQLLQSLLQAMSTILEHQYEANPRFVDAVVRNRSRFQALRDFTVEGGLEELHRLAQERKDRSSAETPDSRPSVARNNSIDSIRTPIQMRSPSLTGVSEDETFAIGEDEDEEEENKGDYVSDRGSKPSGSLPPLSEQTTPRASRQDIPPENETDESVPLQSRSLSEKARGKQPIGQASFSRTTSRNVSSASIPTLSNTNNNTNQQFIPTQAWLDLWIAYLPLRTILAVIDHVVPQHGRTRSEVSPDGRASIVTVTARTTTEHASGDAGDQTHTHRNQRPRGLVAGEPKVQSFQWTSMSLGWYLSLLWGLIYASDTTTNKGINGIWTGTSIKLFNIASRNESISLRRPKGAVDAVGNTIVQRLGSLTFTSGNTVSPTIREV